MKAPGRKGRTFATGMVAAIGLASVAWWIVRGLGICPADGDLAAACREEAGRIGLLAGAIVGGLVALVTAAIMVSNRRAGG